MSAWKNDDNFAVTLHRAYKKGDGWERTSSFFEQNLLTAVHFKTAFDFIQAQE